MLWSNHALTIAKSILADIPNKLIHRLQLIQNSVARIITRSKSTDHVTPLLIKLVQRIYFKILINITFKALHNLSPAYIIDFIHTYTPSRPLQSSSAGLLGLPVINLTTMGALPSAMLHPNSGTHICLTSAHWTPLPNSKVFLQLIFLAYSH